jgi:hypothetical protein
MGEETSSLGLQQPVQGRLRHSQVWPLEHAGQNTAPTPKQLVAGRRLPDQHNVDRIPAIISTAQPHPPAFGGFSLMPSRSKIVRGEQNTRSHIMQAEALPPAGSTNAARVTNTASPLLKSPRPPRTEVLRGNHSSLEKDSGRGSTSPLSHSSE